MKCAEVWGVLPNGLSWKVKPENGKVEDWNKVNDAQREINDCLEYIENISIIKSCGNQSSYGLKHEIEEYNRSIRNDGGGSYVCNGSCIIALMKLNIPLWVVDPHFAFNVVPSLSSKRPKRL
jgi:hypothetical protein